MKNLIFKKLSSLTFAALLFGFSSVGLSVSANAQDAEQVAISQGFSISNTIQVPKSLQNAQNKNLPNGQLQAPTQAINAQAPMQPAQQLQEVVTINEEDLPWLQKKEPPKNENNLIRLIFDETQEGLKADDKTALKSVVNKLQKDMAAKAMLKSYAKPRGENAIKARQAALRRTLEIRQFFETNGVDFKRISVQIMGDAENSLGLDYIDIDKV
jgi:outer membrane protein OmpA-like peptidoglycan-associated protein